LQNLGETGSEQRGAQKMATVKINQEFKQGEEVNNSIRLQSETSLQLWKT
jgi:hypothetical protein